MKNPLRILVIDDDPLMGKTLAEILGFYGFHVLTALGAQEGMEKIRQGIDCVLSDIVMPGKNGVELQMEVFEQVGNVPFLFMTAYADPIVFAQAKEQGALAFLEKPVKIPNLLKILAEIPVLTADPEDQDALCWDPGI